MNCDDTYSTPVVDNELFNWTICCSFWWKFVAIGILVELGSIWPLVSVNH